MKGHTLSSYSTITWGNAGWSVNAWPTWIASTSSTTSITSAATWAHWTAYPDTSVTVQNTWAAWLQQPPAIVSEATRERQRAEVAAWDAQQAAQREKEKAAKKKARELLTTHLTKEQRESLDVRGYFDVDIGGKCYRIRQGTHGNVRLVQDGKEVQSFCIQPPGVPAEDAMLSQKLMLETDEATFLRVANARRL